MSDVRAPDGYKWIRVSKCQWQLVVDPNYVKNAIEKERKRLTTRTH